MEKKPVPSNPYGKSRRKRLQPAENYIGRMERSRTVFADLAIQLRRSKQISYLEPIFQQFLPPNFKGHLTIISVGRDFWLIGTDNAAFGSAFRFYQQEIRASMERHLNQISKKKWKVPELIIKVVPKSAEEEQYQREINAMKSVRTVDMKSREEKREMREKITLSEIIKRLEENVRERHK